MRFPSGRRPLLAGAAFAAGLALAPISAQQPAEPVDHDAVYRIKEEGFRRSRVMEIASWLTDVYGPRLTNSAGFRKAGDWAVKEMTSWGLAHVELAPFPFGRGWTNETFSLTATTPGGRFPVIGMATAWTPGTNGAVSGNAVLAVIETDEDMARFKGKLRGTIVLAQAMRDVPALWTPPASRYTADALEALRTDTGASPQRGRGGRAGGPGRQGGPAATPTFAQRRDQFFIDDGVLATVVPGRGDGGNVFVSGGAANRAPDAGPGLPAVVIAVEHYGRIVRTLQKDLPVTLDLEIANTFSDETTAFNVVADLPGTDKAGEVVMLGAHFDSWHGATGATDNAAGSAVMMEAMRILKQSGLTLRRTVRIGLWGGEEQGLVGSRAYVTAHFADVQDMALKPAHATLSAYFNMDNGTGAIRGIYLQGNEAAAPIFDAWMAPLHSLGMTTLSIRDTGGTDHLPFDRVGLPGFQFIQDEVEYSSRTHHSTMDTYERLQEEDLRKNAVIVATFAYHAANRAGKLPRKPLPPAAGGGGRGTGTAAAR
jgi:hypothetical protein